MRRDAGPREGAGSATTMPSARRRRRVAVLAQTLLAVVSVVVLTLTGYTWVQYRSLDAGLFRSGAPDGRPASAHGDTNLLLIGLDSRLDERVNYP